jgi:hypothetical protein
VIADPPKREPSAEAVASKPADATTAGAAAAPKEAKPATPVAPLKPPAETPPAPPRPAVAPRVRIDEPPENFQFRQSTNRFRLRAVATSEDGEPVTDVEVRVNGRPVPFHGKDSENAWSESTRSWTRTQWITLDEGLNTIVFFARTRRASSLEAVVRGTYARASLPPSPVAKQARPYLGLIPNPKKAFDTGVYLFGTRLDSPAARAGVRANDRLDVFNGRPVRTWEDYRIALSACRPGQRVKLDVVRVTTPMSFTVIVGTGHED